jgi:hypothetical protein
VPFEERRQRKSCAKLRVVGKPAGVLIKEGRNAGISLVRRLETKAKPEEDLSEEEI